jgi:hypothetical protein
MSSSLATDCLADVAGNGRPLQSRDRELRPGRRLAAAGEAL